MLCNLASQPDNRECLIAMPKVTEFELVQIEMAAQRELSWLECANDPYSLTWILSIIPNLIAEVRRNRKAEATEEAGMELKNV